MEGAAAGRYTMTKVVRWTARLWSIASIGLILLFIFGYGMKRVKLSEWSLFLFFPAGVSIGMILAWWKERLGGGITVGSLLLFYVIHFAVARTFPHGWAFLVFSFPGFLFLLCCYPAIKVRNSAM